MQISQRLIGASAPVAPVVWVAPNDVKQSSLPSAWQTEKKLKQLERCQALITHSSTLDLEASIWSPSSSNIIISSTLNPTASGWNPPTTPIAKAGIVKFEVSLSTNYDRQQDNRWGSSGLNPYTVKLLGGELLNAINELGDSFQAVDKFVPTDDDEDDDGDSHFFLRP